MHNIGTEQSRDNYRNHAQVWELLPWYLNGSLPAEEKRQVSAHAAVCLICRKELAAQAALRDAVRNYELDELLVTAGFDRLSARLHDQDAGVPMPLQDLRAASRGRVAGFAGALKGWLQQQFKSGRFVAALSVLAVVLTVPGITAVLLLGNNTFRTLSDGLAETATTADMRLIFADGVSDSERNAILAAADLSIVSGPDGRGLYFVEAGGASATALAATLEQLRANDSILFAELAVGASADGQPSGAR